MSATNYNFFLSSGYRWTVAVSAPLFFYLFLLVFLPFGVSNYNPSHQYTAAFILEIATFAGVTLVLTVLAEVLIKPRLMDSAGIRPVLYWNLGLLVLLGIGNFVTYNYLGDWHDFSLASAASFTLNCASILIFPLAGTFFYFQFRTMRERYTRLKIQGQLDPDPEALFYFKGQGNRETFAVRSSEFRYAQAQDNYVCFYFMRNGHLQRELLRTTLQTVLRQAASEHLVRCHRSYAVYLRHVHSIGDGNPLLLFLQGVHEPIRVSRSRRPEILERLDPFGKSA